jgi:hypothetical protein
LYIFPLNSQPFRNPDPNIRVLILHQCLANIEQETPVSGRGCSQGYILFVCLLLLFKTGSHYAAQADLKLMILLPQPPKYCTSADLRQAWKG